MTVALYVALIVGLQAVMAPTQLRLPETSGRAMLWLLPRDAVERAIPSATLPPARDPVHRHIALSYAFTVTAPQSAAQITADNANGTARDATVASANASSSTPLDLSIVPAVSKAAAAELERTSKMPNKDGYTGEDRWRTLAKRVEDAANPDCLHRDALRNQAPIVIGDYVVGFAGLAALSALAVAKCKGQCR